MKKGLYLAICVFVFSPFFVNADVATADSQYEEELRALISYVRTTYNLEDTTPRTNDEVRDIITDGVAWIVTALESDGRFSYEYFPYEDRYSTADNIVRQAGTLYALGEVLKRDTDAVYDLQEPMKRAIDRFVSLSREDEFLGVTFQCIVEEENSDRCRLGATSLALIAILEYVAAYPEELLEYETLIDDYMSYIVVSKSLRGGYRETHYVGINQQPSANSPFSDGEALLALVRYYDYKNNAVVKSTIDQTFDFLKDEEFDSALYLWMMAALKDMQVLWPNEAYTEYAERFTNWRMARVTAFRTTPKNYCAYIEGVASAYSVLEGTLTLGALDTIRTEIDFWNTRNSHLQIDAGDTIRYFNESGSLQRSTIEDFELARGGFLTAHNVPSQRIDFTQHCVTAYTQTLVDIDEQQF